MALNHVQPGRFMTYTNSTGSDIVSGQMVLVGSLLGVATVDIPDGATGELMMKEIHHLPKATGAIAQGVPLYLDADGDPVDGVAGSGALTTTATDNTLVGHSWAAAASDDAEVHIDLNA